MSCVFIEIDPPVSTRRCDEKGDQPENLCFVTGTNHERTWTEKSHVFEKGRVQRNKTGHEVARQSKTACQCSPHLSDRWSVKHITLDTSKKLAHKRHSPTEKNWQTQSISVHARIKCMQSQQKVFTICNKTRIVSVLIRNPSKICNAMASRMGTPGR